MGKNSLGFESVLSDFSYVSARKDEGKKILCVVTYNKDIGSGHLKRMLRLLDSLGSQAHLYVPSPDAIRLITLLGASVSEEQMCSRPDQDGPWDLIVLDNYQTSIEEAEKWLNLGRVVALDEGGPARGILPYLIDTLPTLPSAGIPNEYETGYLGLPAFSGERTYPPRRILVTFGGIDQAQLTERIGLMLDSHNIPPRQWCVTKGPFFSRTFAWPGIKILDNPNIREILPEFDLVITHFGITAFEAVASGANVVLLNPSQYHEKLSQIAGFPSLGVNDIHKNLQEDFLAYITGKKATHHWNHRVTLNPRKDLGERLLALTGEKGGCPACPDNPKRFGKIVFRNKEKSYAECPICGLIYQEAFTKIDIAYDKDYFFKDYEEQYGRTYLDDFDYICQLSKLRIDRIAHKLKTGSRNLLEIGCAYGAFLKVAHEQGFEVLGVEINNDAAHYIESELHLNVIQTSFPDEFQDEDKQYDVVALWYVLEHFKNLDAAMKKISSLTKPGGIFAFSTPLGDGMTGTYSPKKFFKESPADHYSIFTKKNIHKILARYGFKAIHIEITGVHPERKNIKILPGKKFYNFYKWWYKKRKLGDTFEVYAVKKEK